MPGCERWGSIWPAGMLAKAHTAAPLVRADALRLPLRDASVDGAISGFAIRNVVDIAACFGEAARVIRPGGRAVFLEVSEPPNPVVRFAHSLYFRRIVPMVGGLLSDRSAYRYLARVDRVPARTERASWRCWTGAGTSTLPPGATRHGRGTVVDRDQTVSAVVPAPDLPPPERRTAISSIGSRRTPALCSSATITVSPPPEIRGQSACSAGPDHVRRAASLASGRFLGETVGPRRVVMGALPYEGSCEAILRMPERVILERFPARGSVAPQPAWTVTDLAPDPLPIEYEAAVELALGAIDAGDVEKVVLARTLRVEADAVIDPRLLARRFNAGEPGSFAFLVALPGGASTLVGASPELVVRRRGRKVFSDPLAGTARRSRDRVRDREIARQLLDAVKEQA